MAGDTVPYRLIVACPRCRETETVTIAGPVVAVTGDMLAVRLPAHVETVAHCCGAQRAEREEREGRWEPLLGADREAWVRTFPARPRRRGVGGDVVA